jgi:hypothetical protein
MDHKKPPPRPTQKSVRGDFPAETKRKWNVKQRGKKGGKE